MLMAYVLDIGAVLGAGKTGLTIGYKLINLNETVITAFTTASVIETAVLGNYHVTGGISIPDNFQGRVVFGTSIIDMAEVWLNPSEVEANFNADALLKRSVSHGESTAETSSLTEMILAALNSSISGTTLTIRKTTEATFSTRTVTTSAGAVPIIGID